MRFQREITQRDDVNQSLLSETPSPRAETLRRKGMKKEWKMTGRETSALSRACRAEAKAKNSTEGEQHPRDSYELCMGLGWRKFTTNIYIYDVAQNPWDSIRRILIRRHFIDSRPFFFLPFFFLFPQKFPPVQALVFNRS